MLCSLPRVERTESSGGVSVSEMRLANFRTQGSSSVPLWLHSAQSGRRGEPIAVCGVP